MNYQKMWNTLKQQVLLDLNYHQSGEMQSMSEATHGETKCKEFLALMTKLEEAENEKK